MKDKFIYKLENNKNLWLFAGNFLVFIVFWGGLLRSNFNADTIFHMVESDADVMTNIESGRYVIALGDFILFKMGIRTTTAISITMLVTFILFALAMSRVWFLFEQFSPYNQWSKIGWFIGTELVFLNVLFVELLMFNEYCVYFALGYLLAVLAVEQFGQGEYVSMFILLCIATATYQYTMIFAAILMATYICIEQKAKLSKQAVIKEVVAIFSCMAIGLFNLLSVKILEKLGLIRFFGKNVSNGNWEDKLSDALLSFVNINKNSSNIFPNVWIPFLFGVFAWGLILYSCFKNRKMDIIGYILIVYIGSLLLLYVIPLLQEEFFFPPRMAFCFYLVQGMLILMAYSVCESEQRNLLTAGCICYLVVHLLFSQFIVSNRFVSNTLDEVYANMVYQEILEYEEKTGKIVTGLAVIDDTDSSDSYDEVSYKTGQINERALGTVTNSFLRIISGRYFKLADMQRDVYEEYFLGKNWEYFNLEEQFVIIDDVAYWCVF